MIRNPIAEYRIKTRENARRLNTAELFNWLTTYGYFPECYVLPPCFSVVRCPTKRKLFTAVSNRYPVPWCKHLEVHFPKTDLTNRTYGLIHPEIHNDIAFHISKNWQTILKGLVPENSIVASYTFPIPIDAKHPGRIGHVRSGHAIYEFIDMIEDDIASIAYRYKYIVCTDIKNFYPSIYSHSIPWALHGKQCIRRPANRNDYKKFVGNRLDRLFQCANDGCTNGIPIGPVVSDVIAELIAGAVDTLLTKSVREKQIDCQIVRFKDDYKMLVQSQADGETIVKCLQAALKEYNLEVNEGKTSVMPLPDGLFRQWVSKYHAVHPWRVESFSWKHFRELYLAVLRIDHECPGTGVIDRFLADIVSPSETLKVNIAGRNLQKVMSMLLLLANRRVKAFPKVLAIIEAVLRSPFGQTHTGEIVAFLDKYLHDLSLDEERNKYLIAWVCYFLVSNGLKSRLSFAPRYRDPITRSVFNNNGTIFRGCKHHKLFRGSVATGKSVSMLRHLDVFSPPAFP